MIQKNDRTNAVITHSSAHARGETTSWVAHHTPDVSDASAAEFERLMAAMGYRRAETAGRIK